MLHARQDYNRIQDPDNLIPENEPVFLLRASDCIAPAIVEAWAGLAEASGSKKDIVQLARNHAKLMREWQANHGSKVADLTQPVSNKKALVVDWAKYESISIVGKLSMADDLYEIFASLDDKDVEEIKAILAKYEGRKHEL